jgi:hypothetical protein
MALCFNKYSNVGLLVCRDRPRGVRQYHVNGMSPATSLALATTRAWRWSLQHCQLAPTAPLKGQHTRRTDTNTGAAA